MFYETKNLEELKQILYEGITDYKYEVKVKGKRSYSDTVIIDFETVRNGYTFEPIKKSFSLYFDPSETTEYLHNIVFNSNYDSESYDMEFSISSSTLDHENVEDIDDNEYIIKKYDTIDYIYFEANF